MIATLQEKRRVLEEDRANTDIAAQLSSDHHSRLVSGRKLRRRGQGVEPIEAKLTKKKIVAGPHLVPTLKEAEILEDIYLITQVPFSFTIARVAS